MQNSSSKMVPDFQAKNNLCHGFMRWTLAETEYDHVFNLFFIA